MKVEDKIFKIRRIKDNLFYNLNGFDEKGYAWNRKALLTYITQHKDKERFIKNFSGCEIAQFELKEIETDQDVKLKFQRAYLECV